MPTPTIPEEFLILARHAITSARRDAESELLRQLALAALRAWPVMPAAPSREPLTVRQINRALLKDTPIVATYRDGGAVKQGRIIRARQSCGVLQGKCLGSGVWVRLIDVWEAR